MMHIRKHGKLSEFLQASSGWLLPILFIFPALPLQIVNGFFFLFVLLIFISAIYIRPGNFWQGIKRNLLIAIPFIPYILDFILHSNNSIVGFELQKKLL